MPDSYAIDVNGDNVTDFIMTSLGIEGLNHGSFKTSLTCLNNNEISFSHTDTCYGGPSNILLGLYMMVYPYNFNDTISNIGMWKSNNGILSYNYWGVITDSSQMYGFYCGDTSFNPSNSSYIGVRIFVASDTLYGWIKVKNVVPSSVTIEEYGCQNFTMGIKDNAKKSLFNCYPNPSNNSLKIEILFFNDELFKLTIYNLLGAQLFVKNVPKGVSDIDISNLSDGIYFIKIESKNKTEIKKIIKI